MASKIDRFGSYEALLTDLKNPREYSARREAKVSGDTPDVSEVSAGRSAQGLIQVLRDSQEARLLVASLDEFSAALQLELRRGVFVGLRPARVAVKKFLNELVKEYQRDGRVVDPVPTPSGTLIVILDWMSQMSGIPRAVRQRPDGTLWVKLTDLRDFESALGAVLGPLVYGAFEAWRRGSRKSTLPGLTPAILSALNRSLAEQSSVKNGPAEKLAASDLIEEWGAEFARVGVDHILQLGGEKFSWGKVHRVDNGR